MTENPSQSNFPLAQVHPSAVIHPSVKIGPFSIIEESVEIAEGTQVDPHVIIKSGVSIGKHCKIGAGTVISADTRELEFWREDTSSLYPLGNRFRVRIADHVHIEPSVTIHGEISIGEKCWIGSYVTIHDGARIGKNCKIFPSAIISAIPQDLKFAGEKTTLEVGDNTVIRECATLNRGTTYHGKTVLGKNCLIMAYVHIAHDCIIGDSVIMANAVNLAGHVEIGDHAIMGGMSACHQFVKVGEHVMVSGGSLVRKDVPPYIKVGRDPVRYEGVNSIGLSRRGFQAENIKNIQEVYRHIFLSGKNNTQAREHIETYLPYSEERDTILDFIRDSERGIIRGARRE